MVMKILGRFKFTFRKKSETDLFPFEKHDFDPTGYQAANPDTVGMDPWKHFVKYGYREGRKFTSLSEKIELYITIAQSGYFEPTWYSQEYPDTKNTSPLKHFCDVGVWEGRDPGPNFSTSWYLEQYPDIRGLNPLLHFIKHGLAEGRTPCPPRGALNTLEKGFQSIKDLDALLGANQRFEIWKSVPIVDGRFKDAKLVSTLRLILEEITAETQRLVFVPWCIRSGSDVVVANILRAASLTHGENSTVLVIVDYDRTEGVSWLPERQRIVNFASATKDFNWEDKKLILQKLILAVSPVGCLNVNSHLTWELYKEKGSALSEYTGLHACIFCPDYNKSNIPAGYSSTHLRDTISVLDSVICDNITYPDQLKCDLGLLQEDSNKFTVTKQPIRINTKRGGRLGQNKINSSSLEILWASRICRQKNYKLLQRIICNSPKNYNFHIYGTGEENEVKDFLNGIKGYGNATYYGAYIGFESLPLDKFDVFLYTSLWDGIPNALLEAAAYAFPIIASDVGGIREVVTSENGWLINDVENENMYLQSLDNIFNDRVAAANKGKRLSDFVNEFHSWQDFKNILTQKGAFLGERKANEL